MNKTANSIKKHILCLSALLMLLLAGSAQAMINELFISEYVEGSRFNKAIELYNGTAQTVDLSQYSLDFYLNGATTPNSSFSLSGFLTANTTYVIANSRAASEILIVTDLTSDNIWFNGDDVVVLSRNGQVIDSLGQVGIRYGDAWGSGLLSSRDRTMRRLHDAARADTDIHDTVDFSHQWHGFANDTFDGLGNHVTVGKSFYVTRTNKHLAAGQPLLFGVRKGQSKVASGSLPTSQTPIFRQQGAGVFHYTDDDGYAEFD